MSGENSRWFERLVEVMEKLRGPGGCPWDKEQTHESLKQFLVEECAELLDAIDDGSEAGICEELGDVLMHVAMHSVIAKERGSFDINEVARQSVEKMTRRHPHVFGDAAVSGSGEVLDLWEKIKKGEKKDAPARESILDGMPRHFPSLLRAEKIQRKAAKVGFDWERQDQILDKIEEEVRELRRAMESSDEGHIDEEIGDLLFSVANLTRFRRRATAEELLAAANTKFMRRFRHIEKSLADAGRRLEDASIDEMEALWRESKTKEQD